MVRVAPLSMSAPHPISSAPGPPSPSCNPLPIRPTPHAPHSPSTHPLMHPTHPSLASLIHCRDVFNKRRWARQQRQRTQPNHLNPFNRTPTHSPALAPHSPPTYPPRDVFNERPMGEAAAAALEGAGGGAAGPSASACGWLPCLLPVLLVLPAYHLYCVLATCAAWHATMPCGPSDCHPGSLHACPCAAALLQWSFHAVPASTPARVFIRPFYSLIAASTH